MATKYLSADPTLQFYEAFNNQDEWIPIPNVPICEPHERVVTGKDGRQQKIIVGLEDLQDIAYQLQAREDEKAVPAVVTIGHRQQTDPIFPETQQPPIVGYARHARVGTFGPHNAPAVLATVYYKRANWDRGYGVNGKEGAKDFPFRSMDFYPGTKKVTGVALLKRDPFSALGMVTYDAAGNPTGNMPQTFTSPGDELIQYGYGYAQYADEDRLETSGSHPNADANASTEPKAESGNNPDETDVGGSGAQNDNTTTTQVPNGEMPPMQEETPGQEALVAPEGHDIFVRQLEHAMRTHPVLYGMAAQYASEMNGEPQEGDPTAQDADMMGGEAAPDGDPQDGQQPDADGNMHPQEEVPPGEEMPPGAEVPPEEVGPDGLPINSGDQPPPGQQGELGEEVPPELPKPGEQNAFGTRTAVGSGLGGAAGLGIGAALGHPMAGTLAGAGIGGGLANTKQFGAKSGVLEDVIGNQEDDMPLAYQAVIEQQNKRLAALEAARQSDRKLIAAQAQKTANREAELLVYQLVNQGVKALYSENGTPDLKQIDALKKKFAGMPESARTGFFNEICKYWAKDDSVVQYSAGSPVGGDFVLAGTPAQPEVPTGNGKRQWGTKELARAEEYMKAHPGCDWDEKVVSYAEGNTQIVTG